MRLNEGLNLSHQEARVALSRVLSEGPMSAPKWSFQYDNWHQDPTPEALVLGTYQNPSSGNELVGGINLHYLERDQILELQKALPRIMRGGDLKQRYDIGSRVLPQVFDKAYRTYRTDYVRGVKPSELQYWYDKNTKAAKVQKTQRQKDMDRQAQAQRQAELRRQSMQAMQQPAPPQPRRAGAVQPQQVSAARPMSPRQNPGPMAGRRGATPGNVAPDSLSAMQAKQEQGQAELERMANMQRQRAQEVNQIKQRTDAIKAKQDAQRKLDRERRKNLSQLSRPNPEFAGEGDPLAVESVTYWSSTLGRYITEDVSL